MNCRLAALDMDGTLLMSDKSVHPDTIRDIERAGRKGNITICFLSENDALRGMHERRAGI